MSKLKCLRHRLKTGKKRKRETGERTGQDYMHYNLCIYFWNKIENNTYCYDGFFFRRPFSWDVRQTNILKHYFLHTSLYLFFLGCGKWRKLIVWSTHYPNKSYKIFNFFLLINVSIFFLFISLFLSPSLCLPFVLVSFSWLYMVFFFILLSLLFFI